MKKHFNVLFLLILVLIVSGCGSYYSAEPTVSTTNNVSTIKETPSVSEESTYEKIHFLENSITTEQGKMVCAELYVKNFNPKDSITIESDSEVEYLIGIEEREDNDIIPIYFRNFYAENCKIKAYVGSSSNSLETEMTINYAPTTFISFDDFIYETYTNSPLVVKVYFSIFEENLNINFSSTDEYALYEFTESDEPYNYVYLTIYPFSEGIHNITVSITDNKSNVICESTSMLGVYAPANANSNSSVPSTTNVCTYCKGTGIRQCFACNSTGKMTCYICQGFGTVLMNGEHKPCGICYGEGKIRCTYCVGNGGSTCTICHGYGTGR